MVDTKIVVLDQNEFDRKILEDLLARKNYRVSCPEPDEHLLEAIKNQPVGCIFTEHTVGDYKAVDFIHEIRREPELEGVPIILLTTADHPERQIQALKAGASLCLTKPFDSEELLTKLDVQLRLWRLQSELHEQFEINQSLLLRLKADLALGQQVQKSFLPPSQMRTSNFNLEAQLIPSSDLSGDYFDYKLITPERLVIFLADVSGHGVASALLAGRLKAFFDENFRRAHRPRLFLEQLNRVLIDLGEHYHIATAVCVHIDVVETAMTYANAGHRTLYWLDGDVHNHTLLPATGPALGMFEEFDINEATHGFLPGRNRLVSFTDGLIEFRKSSGEWSTEEQFRDNLLLPMSNLPIDEYLTALLEGSRRLTGEDGWDDDVSLVITDF